MYWRSLGKSHRAATRGAQLNEIDRCLGRLGRRCMPSAIEANASVTNRKNSLPDGVSEMPRTPRSKRAVSIPRSREATPWLTALGVKPNSLAASLKLPCRPADSNNLSVVSGGNREITFEPLSNAKWGVAWIDLSKIKAHAASKASSPMQMFDMAEMQKPPSSHRRKGEAGENPRSCLHRGLQRSLSYVTSKK